jgi:hypothetical protein
MKRLVLGALVAALCSVPSMSRAETAASAPREIAAPAQRSAQATPAPDGSSQRSEDEASEYAAREQAAPHLAEFAGGADGIYIGAGALGVALLVALLIIAL